MTKTLGSAALKLYAGVVSMFLLIPAENQTGLLADLEGDPFVGHALSSATCQLSHCYGMFLTPLTTALTTIKHCQFGHRCPAVLLSSMTEIKQTAESPQAVRWNGPQKQRSRHMLNGQRRIKRRIKKSGGRACRRCRPAKATARTASGSLEIITTTCQRS